jgi:hypothetical protein
MTITVNGVAVPAQSKTLDTTTVTTGFGLVHRQIIGIADPENQSQYARLTGTSLNVNVTNTAVAISATSLPLPTGAATESTLLSIDGKIAGFGTAGTPSADVISVQGISGGEPLSVDVIQPVITKPASSSYLHLNANGTTTVKSGAGVLRRIVINTKGGITNTLTIYNNTTATGAVIGVVDTGNTAGGAFDYELDFTTGLTVVLAGGLAADITIIYE